LAASTLTGGFFSTELAAKRLELLRELVSGAARVAVLVNPANAVVHGRYHKPLAILVIDCTVPVPV